MTISSTEFLRSIRRQSKRFSSVLDKIPPAVDSDLTKEKLEAEVKEHPILRREIQEELAVANELRRVYAYLEGLFEFTMAVGTADRRHARELAEAVRFDLESQVKGVYGDHAKLLMEVRNRQRRHGADSDSAYG